MTAAITTIILLTTAIMTITTSTTTAMVMMAWLLLLLLLRLMRLVILRRYTVAIPMVEQVRTDFDVRFHLLVVFAGQIATAADRWFPAAAATKGHRLVCTCTFNVVSVVAAAAATTITAAAIQSIRLASLFVEFHIS